MSHGKHQDRLNESLSALMDGEVSELELQRLLKASSSSAEIGERWSRYQLAASVMRRERVAQADTGLAARISAAVEQEAAPFQSTDADAEASAANRNRWWQPLRRGAVAATVAFAAILGVQQMSQPQVGGDAAQVADAEHQVQPSVSSAPEPTGFYVPAPSTRSVSTAAPRLVPERQGAGAVPGGKQVMQPVLTPELMRHLNRVMMEHSEQAAHVGSQGMVPFARATFGEQVDM
ncbi:sigma-E factor negative regulatory protein [Microbulbifer sp. SAOS-129_SWC]|uniref:sigma-E factor negative regulatory protein n=1 Tax=Microbulbifer sp. SAOS-129_SWC TaxID=3145235 RepID=UPI0032168B99